MTVPVPVIVVVPLMVYMASYIGRFHTSIVGWPHAFARRQLHMLRFHIDLTSGQQYQSRPWEWLAIRRPIAYFFSEYHGRYREVIAIGTPFVWWPGALGVLVAAWSTLRNRSAARARRSRSRLPFFCFASCNTSSNWRYVDDTSNASMSG